MKWEFKQLECQWFVRVTSGSIVTDWIPVTPQEVEMIVENYML